MITIQRKHTSELDKFELELIYTMLQAVYGRNYSLEDFSSCLGGIHFLTWDDQVLVGQVSLIQ